MSKTSLTTGTSTNAIAISTASVAASPLKASTAASASLTGLQQAESQGKEKEGSGVVAKGVAAALASLTLFGAMPSHADTVNVAAPQAQAGLFLDSNQLHQTRFADTDYQKLLGVDTTVTIGRADVDGRAKAAFQQFEGRLLQIMQADVGSRAAGLKPLDGSALTDVQTSQLKSAFKDLMTQVPIGAFSPEVQNTLEAALGALGDSRDLSTSTLKEFGKLGGDAAETLVKDFVKDFKNDHPAAFWSMAGAGAAAAVAVGYTQGTEALAKVGIKPEVKTKLFGDVSAKVGVLTGPKFSDPRLTVGLDGKHTFDNGTTVRGGLEAQLAGKTLTGGKATVGVTTTGGFALDGQMRFDGSGKPFDAHLSASQRLQFENGQGVIFGQGNWSNGTNGTADAASATLGYAGTHGRWTTSVSGTYDFKNDNFTSSLAAGRTFDIQRKDDLELQIRGSVNNRGDAYVGAAVQFRF